MPDSEMRQAESIARIAQDLLHQPETESTAQRIVTLAVENVPGCAMCSITTRDAGSVQSPAFSEALAKTVDLWQYQLDEGPCLSALVDGNIHLCDDLGAESQWPAWAARAVAAGIRSVLSVRLATPDTVLGALNLYSPQVGAFNDDSVDIGAVYARIASGALFAARETSGLREALESRNVIGIAQGVLMNRYGLSRDQSFEVLRRRSQEGNTKIRDLAAQIIEEHQRLGRC